MGRLEELQRQEERRPAEELAQRVAATAQLEVESRQQQNAELHQELQALKAKQIPQRALILLVVCTGLMAMTMVVANLLALKIWDFCGTPVDGGIFLFPLTYLLGDMLCELFDKPIADLVAIVSALGGGLTVVFLRLILLLPDHYLADNSAYVILVEACGIVMVASVVSFLVGQLLNNAVFHWIRNHFELHRARLERLLGPKLTKLLAYPSRSLGSSLPAHLVDAMIFEIIAFYGRLPFTEFLKQVVFAFVAGVIVEAGLWSVNAWLVNRLATSLHYRHGQAWPTTSTD